MGLHGVFETELALLQQGGQKVNIKVFFCEQKCGFC
jgi:hypothetical protein